MKRVLIILLMRLKRLSKASVLIPFIILLLLSFWGLSQLKVSLTSDHFIDSSLSSAKEYEFMKDHFEEKPFARIELKKLKGTITAEDLCRFSHRYSKKVLQADEIYFSLSLLDLKKIVSEKNRFFFERIIKESCSSELLWDEILLHPMASKFIRSDLSSHYFYLYFSEKNFSIQQFEEMKKEFTDFPGYKTHFSGSAPYQYHIFKSMQITQWANVAGLLVVGVALFLFFSHLASAFIFVLFVVILNLFIHGLMGLFGSPINNLSLSLFLILTVSSIEDYAYLLYFRSLHPEKSWNFIFKRLALPSFLTSLTTFIGFGSLLFSPLIIIQEYGLWTALGSLLEWILFIPFLSFILNKFPRLSLYMTPKKVFRFSILNKGLPYRFSYLLLLIFPLALFCLTQLHPQSSPLNIFGPQHFFTQQVEYQKKREGWLVIESLVFPDSNLSTTQKEDIIHKIQNINEVHSVMNPYSVLNYFKTSDGPQRNKNIEQTYRFSHESRLFFSEEGAERALLYLKHAEIQSINSLKKRIDQICKKDCFLTGELTAFSEFSIQLISTLMRGLFLSLSLIAFVIVLTNLRSPFSINIKILISSFWGPAVLVSLMYLLDFHIDMISCIIFSVIIGLTGDNALHYRLSHINKKFKENIKSIGSASLMSSFFMILLSLCFLISPFSSIQNLGLLLATGFLFSFIGDYFILKSLFKDEGL